MALTWIQARRLGDVLLTMPLIRGVGRAGPDAALPCLPCEKEVATVI